MSCAKPGERIDIDSHQSLIGRFSMSGRVQLALNVSDIGQAVAFYTRLFGTGPAKLRPAYANFAVADPPLKLVLLENPGQGGTLNHLGIEVPDTGTVDAEQARLTAAGLASEAKRDTTGFAHPRPPPVAAEQARLPAAGLASVDKRDTTCCYARQDKFWVQGAPDGESWEIYTVLADSQTFYDEDPDAPECCATDASAQAEPAASAGRCC